MTTWTQVHQTTPVGPVAPVAAGAALFDGWIDFFGNQWQIGADGFLQGAVTPSPANSWYTTLLARPVTEAMVDGQITARVNYTPANTQGVFLMLRVTGSSSATMSGYYATWNTNVVKMYQLVNGAATGITATPTGSFTPVQGTAYDFQFNLVTVGATTNLTFNVMAAGTTTVLYSATGSSTTASLQNVAGVSRSTI
jgi:hypothetical protein